MRADQEANLLSSYLTNRLPTAAVLTLYKQALQKVPVEFNPKQKKVWEFCIKHQWSLQFVDAALAFDDQYHPIRKRIFVMLAILETQPAYNDCFLPRQQSTLFIFYLFLRLVTAALKTGIGKILLWFI